MATTTGQAKPKFAKRDFSARQVGKRLGKPHQTIIRWCKEGRLRATRDEIYGWSIDPESVAEVEEQLAEADAPVSDDPVAEKMADLIESVSQMAAIQAKLADTLTKPLELFLRYNEQLLKIAIDRNKMLEEAQDSTRQKYDEALSHANERALAVEKQKAHLEMQKDGLGWLKETLPVALRFGPMLEKFEKLAPFLGAMSAQDAEDFAANVAKDYGEEVGDALRDIARDAREILAAKKLKDQQVKQASEAAERAQDNSAAQAVADSFKPKEPKS